MAFCSNCGKELRDGAKFCSMCGNPCDNSLCQSTTKFPYKTILGAIIVLVCICGGWIAWNIIGNNYSLEGLAKAIPNYDNVYEFNEGLASVCKDGKYGYIDKKGKEIIPTIYDEVFNFNEGLACVYKDGKYKYGCIDKKGNTIIPFIYDNISNYSEGLASVRKDGKYGYIDKRGNTIIPFIYDNAWKFSEGLARVCKDEKLGYIDKKGNEIIPFIYDDAYHFNDGLAFVRKDGKYGFIDKAGNIIIPFIYDYVHSFSEGLASVRKDGKYGYIDKKDKVIIPTIYDEVFDFNEGLARVIKGKKYGYIDNKGNEIIPFIYDYGYDFSEGLVSVCKDGKYGYIDKKGNEIIPFIYDEAYNFNEGLAVVKKNGFYGYVDKKGSSTFDFQKNEVNSEDVIKNRLNEIVKFALNNSDDEGITIEKYFSNDFRELYKRMVECDNKNPDSEGLWYCGYFWSGSSEGSPSTMVAGNVNEINGNRAIVDLIIGEENGLKQIVSASLVFEDGNWFVDDIIGRKKELKEEVEGCEDYVKYLLDDSWLQGHWVYEQGNYKGHFVIEGNTITQYSSMNSERYKATFRIEDGAIRARLVDGMDLVVPIDYVNQRIDYGDGNWMHKVDY